MTSNLGNASYSFNSIQYNKLKSENSNVYDVFRTVDWQQGVLWGQSYNVVPFDYVSTAGSPNLDHSYHIALDDNEDSRKVWSIPASNGNIVNFTVHTGQISNYMMGGSGQHNSNNLKSISKDSLKYDVRGYMYMYRIKPPYYLV